jgi:vesicle-fusing ATPase
LLDLVFVEPALLTGSILELTSDEVGEVMATLYKSKFLNFLEQIPI